MFNLSHELIEGVIIIENVYQIGLDREQLVFVYKLSLLQGRAPPRGRIHTPQSLLMFRFIPVCRHHRGGVRQYEATPSGCDPLTHSPVTNDPPRGGGWSFMVFVYHIYAI